VLPVLAAVAECVHEGAPVAGDSVDNFEDRQLNLGLSVAARKERPVRSRERSELAFRHGGYGRQRADCENEDDSGGWDFVVDRSQPASPFDWQAFAVETIWRLVVLRSDAVFYQ